ncbi:MAG: cytochrome c oxidase subunit II [Pyrinomonadaceae bacterium]
MGRVLGVLIWLLTIGSVWLFVNGRWWLPRSIVEHGEAYDRQFLITIIVVGVTFALAQIGLGYAVWRYGARRNDRGRAVYSHGNNRMEMLWTGVTFVIFVSLGLMGQRVWAKLHLNEAPTGSTRVHVVAQQFQWNFHYPGADNTFGKTSPDKIDDGSLNFVGLDESDPAAIDDPVVTTLVVPVNRPVELLLQSKDVTHDLWVPELRYKQDLVPGLTLKMHFKPIRTGRFELACAELCGQLHFKMKSFLIVVPQTEHDELMSLAPAQFTRRITELNAKYPLGIQPGQ